MESTLAQQDLLIKVKSQEYLHDEESYNAWVLENLDMLVRYPYWLFRCTVAQLGNKEHLDKLVGDEDDWVRLMVAKRGYKEHLDELVHDVSPSIRLMVASFGYKDHLDILIDDEDYRVHTRVKLRLSKKDYIEL